ncbi:MAG: HAMP domain-containing histidine kinase [Oligoflexia bacterium]|nr:HAMP domain-containing histidine kinase [Oligoflexia bacterium]
MLNNNFEDQAYLMSKLLENNMRISDYSEIQYIAKNLIKNNTDLIYVRVDDENGLPIIELNKDDFKSFVKRHEISINLTNTKTMNGNVENIGKFKAIFSLDKFENVMIKNLSVLLSSIIFCIIGLLLLMAYFKNRFNKFISNLSIGFKNIQNNTSLKLSDENNFVEEFTFINRSFNQTLEIVNAHKELEKLNVIAETKVKLASQVSHDIRSPLAALTMAVKRVLPMLAEDDRIIIRTQIQRIQDIANNLLAKNRKAKENENNTSDDMQLKAQLLSSCIEELITEKRLECRSFLDLNIEANIDNTYGIFAKINLANFKRILSNLINNAREAFDNNKGNIVVHLEDGDEFAKIIVEDNGKGIPPEILSKLGKEGASFGKEKNKESGSGIGLYSAIKTVESLGGKFEIQSTVGVGTKMIIYIPKATAPDWFVSEIKLKPHSAIVILDDDQGIHQTWDTKLNVFDLQKHDIDIVHLSTPDNFREWTSQNKTKENIIYFCDYELLGHKISGLDLIEEAKLNTNAILVTSRYEEEKIRERCERLKVKLIPKMIVGMVPIQIDKKSVDVDNKESSNLKSNVVTNVYDVVYLDDDLFLRMGWEQVAKSKGFNILTIGTPNELLANENNFSLENTEIYLDNNLGDGEMKGEELAVILHDKGFKKLHLATGYDAEKFAHLDWLKVIGKDCPFEEDNWT